MERMASKQTYTFQESGSFQIAIQDTCHIEVAKHTHVQLYITYDKEQIHQQLEMVVQDGAEVRALFLAENHVQGSYEHQFKIMKDASVHIGYGELYDGDMTGTIHCDLLASGAKVHILHATLASDKKSYQITCEHHQPHTEGVMDNYAVVSKAGKYNMEACGKIVKGAYGSVSHQHTHVLTMSDQHHSTVIPLLLIDENDVEASHAMSLGQPDMEQLYYLQSRGLSYQQALGLLMLGYILPLSTLLEEEGMQTQLQEMIERKVGLYV